MALNKIELLNSEGPILTAIKVNDLFEIIDQYNHCIAILNKKQMQSFVHEEIQLVDSKQRKFIYSSYPGSMKPDLKKLDEFIGIDTQGRVY